MALQPQPLQVVILDAGSFENLHGDVPLWTDFDRGGTKWAILVSGEDSPEDWATQAGATLLRSYRWTGVPFGDGTIGTVESPAVGVLVVGDTAMRWLDRDHTVLPVGWVVIRNYLNWTRQEIRKVRKAYPDLWQQILLWTERDGPNSDIAWAYLRRIGMAD